MSDTGFSTCASCGTALTGKYCATCGEKTIDPKHDFTLAKFMEQVVDGMTHFDSKFFKTVSTLLFRPGKLTTEYMAGRRVGYMKPIQIFILSTVLFYLAYPLAMSFYSNPEDIERGLHYKNHISNTFQFDIGSVIQQKALERKSERQTVLSDIAKGAAHTSKAWIFLLIPFFGLASFLLFRKNKPYFVQHLVFAMHGLSFYVVLDMLFISACLLLNYRSIQDEQILVLLIIFLVYLMLSVRRFFEVSWTRTLLFGIPLFLSFLFFLVLYRQCITIWVATHL